MSDVLVVSDVGRGLLGGEAVLTAMRSGLDEPFVAASSNDADTAAYHGLPAVPRRSWRDVTRALRRSRAVVFAGNVPFQPLQGRHHSSQHLRRSLALAALARATGRTVCVVAAGASGYYDGTTRALARRLARQADLLILRDDASAHAMIDLGMPPPLRVGADAAWTLLDNAASGGDGDLAGRVVLVPPSMQMSDPLTEHLVALTTALPVETVVAPAGRDIVGLARRLGGARLVVSREFHVTAAAAAAGAPVLSFVNDDSERALAERLGQPWAPFTLSRPELEATLLRALDAPAPARAVVQAEIAAADETLGLLRLVLSGGAMSAENIAGLRLEPAS